MSCTTRSRTPRRPASSVRRSSRRSAERHRLLTGWPWYTYIRSLFAYPAHHVPHRSAHRRPDSVAAGVARADAGRGRAGVAGEPRRGRGLRGRRAACAGRDALRPRRLFEVELLFFFETALAALEREAPAATRH